MIKDSRNFILPKFRPSTCVSYHAFDGPSTSIMTNRVSGTLNHTGTINPKQISSCTGTGVRFGSAANHYVGNNVAESAVSSAVTAGDLTITCLVRPTLVYDPASVVERPFFYLGGDHDVSNVNNIEMGTVGNLLYIRWQPAGGSEQVITFDDSTGLPLLQLQVNTWHMLSLSFDSFGTTMSLYVNGTLYHQRSTSLQSADPTTMLVYAGKPSGGSVSSNWEGDMDMVSIDNFTLNPQDIEEDFRRFSGHLHPSFVTAKVVLKGELDLSNVFGQDMLLSAKVDIDAESGIRKATVTCVREVGKVSLSPLVLDTPLSIPNPSFPGTFSQYIDIRTPVVISCVRSPIGHMPREDNYTEVLNGQLDEFDPSPDTSTIRFTARDRVGLLVDYFIPTPQIYAREIGVPEAFKIGTLDEIVIDEIITNNSSSFVFGAPPRFIVDKPYESDWKLMDYEQRPESLFTALKAIANGLGWNISYEWDPIKRSWRLKYYEPQRLKTNNDNIIKPYDILAQGSFKTTAANIRNVVRISFSDFEAENNLVGSTRTPTFETGATTSSELYGKDSEGNRLPGYVEYQDGNSVALYGRRYMQMNEFTARGIGRIEEASKLAIAVLRELKQPDVESTIELRSLPEIDIDDILYMKQDLRIHTSDLRMSVKSISHSFGVKSKTSITLQGKPGWGPRKFLQLEARAGQAPTPLHNPDTSLLDKSSRDIIPNLRAIMEKSRLFSENGNIDVPNNNFNSRSRGIRYTPDSWTTCQWNGNNLTEPDFNDDMGFFFGFNYFGKGATEFLKAFNADLNVEVPPTSGSDIFGLATSLLTLPVSKYNTTSVLGAANSTILTRDMKLSLVSKRSISGGANYATAVPYIVQYDENKEFIEITDIDQASGVTVPMGTTWTKKISNTESITIGIDNDYTSTFRILDTCKFIRVVAINNSATSSSVIGQLTIDSNEAYSNRSVVSDAFTPITLPSTMTDNTFVTLGYRDVNTATDVIGLRDQTGREGAIFRADLFNPLSTAFAKHRIYVETEGSIKIEVKIDLKGVSQTGNTIGYIRVQHFDINGFDKGFVISSSAIEHKETNGSASLVMTGEAIVTVHKGEYFTPSIKIDYRSDVVTLFSASVQAMGINNMEFNMVQLK